MIELPKRVVDGGGGFHRLWDQKESVVSLLACIYPVLEVRNISQPEKWRWKPDIHPCVHPVSRQAFCTCCRPETRLCAKGVVGDKTHRILALSELTVCVKVVWRCIQQAKVVWVEKNRSMNKSWWEQIGKL